MKFALLACTDQAAVNTIVTALGSSHHVDIVSDRDACIAQFSTRRYDVTFLELALLDAHSGSGNGVDYDALLQPFWDEFPAADIVVLAKNHAIREAVRVVKAGASNYLTFPIDPEELNYSLESIDRANLAEAELDYLRGEFWCPDAAGLVRTRSPLMQDVFQQMRLVAPTKANVLLVGETGTGKSLLAKLIHQHSPRADGPFVSVHCGAIPDTLIESELFGHEKGAFTGATQRRLGKFEIANGGTIFLDEVSTLTPAAQIKLLQVIQERFLQRVGGETCLNVDVRVLAATNIDLKPLCQEGKFRTDLFYRLNVFPIAVPPLRERREDIPGLIESFVRRACVGAPHQLRLPPPEVLVAMQRYPWPGNVRELENVIERAVILEQGSALSARSIPSDIINSNPAGAAAAVSPDVSLTLEEARTHALDVCAKAYLTSQLTAHGGRIDHTAEAAGITPRHLHHLMKRHNLHKEDFRA